MSVTCKLYNLRGETYYSLVLSKDDLGVDPGDMSTFAATFALGHQLLVLGVPRDNTGILIDAPDRTKCYVTHLGFDDGSKIEGKTY